MNLDTVTSSGGEQGPACSLRSLLTLGCRSRAETFAKKLQSKLWSLGQSGGHCDSDLGPGQDGESHTWVTVEARLDLSKGETVVTSVPLVSSRNREELLPPIAMAKETEKVPILEGMENAKNIGLDVWINGLGYRSLARESVDRETDTTAGNRISDSDQYFDFGIETPLEIDSGEELATEEQTMHVNPDDGLPSQPESGCVFSSPVPSSGDSDEQGSEADVSFYDLESLSQSPASIIANKTHFTDLIQGSISKGPSDADEEIGNTDGHHRESRREINDVNLLINDVEKIILDKHITSKQLPCEGEAEEREDRDSCQQMAEKQEIPVNDCADASFLLASTNSARDLKSSSAVEPVNLAQEVGKEKLFIYTCGAAGPRFACAPGRGQCCPAMEDVQNVCTCDCKARGPPQGEVEGISYQPTNGLLCLHAESVSGQSLYTGLDQRSPEKVEVQYRAETNVLPPLLSDCHKPIDIHVALTADCFDSNGENVELTIQNTDYEDPESLSHDHCSTENDDSSSLNMVAFNQVTNDIQFCQPSSQVEPNTIKSEVLNDSQCCPPVSESFSDFTDNESINGLSDGESQFNVGFTDTDNESADEPCEIVECNSSDVNNEIAAENSIEASGDLCNGDEDRSTSPSEQSETTDSESNGLAKESAASESDIDEANKDNLEIFYERSPSESPERDDDDEDEKPPRRHRVQRSTSLKTGKTPPGTPGRKKIVRFADALGLDLALVRTFLDEIPNVPQSAFQDLSGVEDDSDCLGNSGLPGYAASYARRRDNPLPEVGSTSNRSLIASFTQPSNLPDFLDRVKGQKVCLETAAMIEDMTLRGVVRVLNIDFHKSVVVRVTTDEWLSFTDVSATYVPNSCDGLSDRFSFTLFAHSLQPGQKLLFALCYRVAGQEFWDNNQSLNYMFQCVSTSHCMSSPMLPSPTDRFLPYM